MNQIPSIDKKGLGIGILVIIGVSFSGFLISTLWSMPFADSVFVKYDCNNSNDVNNFIANSTEQKISNCVFWNHSVDTNKPIMKWGGFIIFTFGIPIAIAHTLFNGFQIHRPLQWILEKESKDLKSKGLNPHGTLPKGFDETSNGDVE